MGTTRAAGISTSVACVPFVFVVATCIATWPVDTLSSSPSEYKRLASYVHGVRCTPQQSQSLPAVPAALCSSALSTRDHQLHRAGRNMQHTDPVQRSGVASWWGPPVNGQKQGCTNILCWLELKILYPGPLHEGQASPRLSVACLPLAASAAMLCPKAVHVSVHVYR